MQLQHSEDYSQQYVPSLPIHTCSHGNTKWAVSPAEVLHVCLSWQRPRSRAWWTSWEPGRTPVPSRTACMGISTLVSLICPRNTRFLSISKVRRGANEPRVSKGQSNIWCFFFFYFWGTSAAPLLMVWLVTADWRVRDVLLWCVSCCLEASSQLGVFTDSRSNTPPTSWPRTPISTWRSWASSLCPCHLQNRWRSHMCLRPLELDVLLQPPFLLSLLPF